MEWISIKDYKPTTVKSEAGNFEASNIVAVLIDKKERLTAQYNTGIDEEGNEWDQWYCPAYEDIVEDVTHWIPLPKTP